MTNEVEIFGLPGATEPGRRGSIIREVLHASGQYMAKDRGLESVLAREMGGYLFEG